ncbi:MAG TPA: cupin domain-containing protein [Chthonomonadaceae bacterium]|nr:cupin domain-containing protein [Chthonomonadaceae bacterium]
MTFTPLEVRTGLLLDLSADIFPTQVYGWSHADLALPGEATHYGIVTEGECVLRDAHGTYRLRAGMFFVCPAEIVVEGETGRGMVISRLGYRGLWQIGGPLEAEGRLQYIDGCTDTLLVSPPRLGDPCLNHLHIPPHTNQSPHTHPSERIGVILRGRGECRTPEGVFPLQPGMGWWIPTGCLHSFYTQDAPLDVVAWHPESDFGPTDENHPMRNKTLLAQETSL